MAGLKDLFLRCRVDPQFESEFVDKRPLRGPQAEVIQKVERFIGAHEGGVMTIMSARQTGKNEVSAKLHTRHLFRNQFASKLRSWIRTAPTYKPQIVNSKKRLREILNFDTRNVIHHPLFQKKKLVKEEGYIWRLGNASVEFISSGPNSNVVGATASECLDMDEAHKVDKAKFDEDFAPFVADTNAGTLLWGVAADGHDTIEWYRQKNIEDGQPHLNLFYPCDIWMETHPPYRAHVEGRVNKLGWDHPIIRTQYRLLPVAAEGRFLSDAKVRGMLDSDHPRQRTPLNTSHYEFLIDIAAGNEDFNPDNILEGVEDTKTDSTVIWIYEVSPLLCANGVFPILRIVNLVWITGASLSAQEEEIDGMIAFWNPHRVTIDGVGVGRQIAEAMEAKYGPAVVNKYTASDTSVSEDCFDLLARLNFHSVKMFQNDGSPEWAEFERQCGWTKYTSSKGKMKLVKPSAEKHIDMVKGLTYIHQNSPVGGTSEMYSVESEYDV